MIKAIVSDFSRVLLTPTDDAYTGALNELYRKTQKSDEYDFWSYFQLNRDLLTFFDSLRDKVALYVFTSEYIQEDPAVRPLLDEVFAEVFSGADLNLKKTEANSYVVIAQKVNLKPEEIIYVDDKQANLDAAREAGMQTVLFTDNAILEKDVDILLEKFTK